MKTTTVKTTNNLKHTIHTKDSDGNILDIEIRLNDECKNGYNDFAITCSAYDKKGNGSRGHKWFLYGGCSHDEILKVRPDLKIFVDLHLSDVKGAPMYPSANGFYYLKNSSYEVTKEYMRATDEQMKELSQAEDEKHFCFILENLGFVEQWQKEANQGIALLEEMTGQKFSDDSVRFQYVPLTEEEKADLEGKLKSGFYTADSMQKRAEEKERLRIEKLLQSFEDTKDKKIAEATLDCDLDIAIVRAGLPHDNFIYYHHSGEGVFNWHKDSYHEQITQEQFNAFLKSLPDSIKKRGIVFKIK